MNRMTLIKQPTLLVMISMMAGVVHAASPTEFHVSPTGKHGASGTQSDPFPSLVEAVTAVKALPLEKKAEGVTVFLSGGTHTLPSGVTFDASCSGTSNAPLTIAPEADAHPVLTAGRAVSGDQLEPVTDRGLQERLDSAARDHVRQVDLKKLGVPAIAPFREIFRGDWRPLMVTFGTNSLPISRWPNGEYGFTTMKSVTDNGDATHGGTFVYRDDRPSRWQKALEDNQLWLRGFWRVPWVINGAQVKLIDTNACTITLMKDVGGGIGSKYKKDAQGRRSGDGTEAWCAVNLPEEIDQPGEWAVDFKRQLLLIWPPDGVTAQNPILIAANKEPLLAIDNASNVTVKGVTLLGSLGDGIRIQGGENNLVAGCNVSQITRTGIALLGGKHHRALSNDVRETGASGIAASGGVKATLEPAGHEILNNDVSRAANDFPEPAIQIGVGGDSQILADAVGIRVAHNRIHDTANAGVRFGGCDNVFELNEVYRIGLNSGDLGGFYGYCGFTGFGNVMRNNFVHHSMNGNAFYMDDGTSGATVTGNVAYKCAMGVLMGGGHYNRFLNNIIIDCTKGIHLDDRGVSRKYTLEDKRLGGDVRSVSPDRAPWKEKHPELAALVAGVETTFPKGDEIVGNVLINCATPMELPKPENASGILEKGNVTSGSPADFVDAENFDFTVRPGSTLLATIAGFPPIPFQQIGLQVDEYRKSIPPKDMKLLKEGNTTKRKFSSTTDIEASNKK
jgi:parallel beta-helix repeat protein